MKTVKQLKPNKFKAYDKFYTASYGFMSEKQIKELLDIKRKAI
jgi:biotin operon repressor